MTKSAEIKRSTTDVKRRAILKHITLGFPASLVGCVLENEPAETRGSAQESAAASTVQLAPPAAQSNSDTDAATRRVTQAPPSTVTFRTTPPPANGRPAWMSAIPIGAWGEVPESLFFNGAAWNYMRSRYYVTNILRGEVRSFNAYSGGVLNTVGAYTNDGGWLPGPIYVRWGGGHAATDSNAVMGLHLNTDVPQWYVLKNPRLPGLGPPDDASYAAEDRFFVDPVTSEPISPHTYDYCQYEESTNRMILPVLTAAGVLGRSAAYAIGFRFGDASGAPWQRLAANHSTMSGSPFIQLCFLKPSNRTVYYTENYGCIQRRKLDLASNTVTVISNSAGHDQITGSKEGLASAFDADSDIVLYTASGTDKVYAIAGSDFENASIAPVNVTPALQGAGIPEGANSDANGVVLDPVERCWYYWTNAEPGNLRKIVKPSGPYRAGSWSSTLINGGNPMPALGQDFVGQTQHMYGALRFVRVGSMRGILLGRSIGDTMRFFRIA